MTERATELTMPLSEDEEDEIVVPVDPEVWDEVRVLRGSCAGVYRLKVPTFTGEGDLEYFIKWFKKTMEFARWPPRMALTKLRLALTGKAKPYGMGTDVGGIFASLRARFGISAMQRSRVASRHVGTEPSAAPVVSSADDPVVANIDQETVASKAAETTSLLTKLLSMLAPLCQADNTREFNEPRVPSPGGRHLVCWGCGKTGHFRRNCPHLYPGLNCDGPRMLPHPTGRQ